MDTKHTPGPWESDGLNIGRPVNDFGMELVARAWPTSTAEEDRANARLIATAPELLEAANRMVSAWDEPSSSSVHMRADAIEMLRAAIAKAVTP